jgi:hypothetical protein
MLSHPATLGKKDNAHCSAPANKGILGAFQAGGSISSSQQHHSQYQERGDTKCPRMDEQMNIWCIHTTKPQENNGNTDKLYSIDEP